MTMETGKLELFPTTKRRRPKDKVVATQECLVYCNCRLPEFRVIVCCGNCCEWFHEDCITTTESIPNDIDNWMYELQSLSPSLFVSLC